MFDILELHQRLVAQARVSGSEQTGIGKLVQELARPFVDEISTDAMGNVICRKKGEGQRVMLSAHMDAIGFMVTGVDENGFASVAPIGGHQPAQLVGCRVAFANGARGVLCLRESGKKLACGWTEIGITDLYLDLGAPDRETACKLVHVGDTCTFEGLPVRAAGNTVMGPYADDLIGCVVLLLAMERLKSSKYDVYFVFSTQEEVGCRGALSAAQAIRPNIGIACDVCGTDDTPFTKNSCRTKVLGGGATIKIKDGSVICSPALNRKLQAVADKENIPWQAEILLAGGTDTSSMQKALENVAATCVSIPTRHIHSPSETYDLRDVDGAASLLAAFLNS